MNDLHAVIGTERLSFRSGGVYVAGTDVPVREIAALLRGQTIPEIVEDYPGLTAADVAAADAYVAAHPDPSDASRPVRSFKRMLADAATAGVWDVD